MDKLWESATSVRRRCAIARGLEHREKQYHRQGTLRAGPALQCMARPPKKYRPGIDDPPEPTAVTRAVHWVFAEALRLLTIIFKRR